MKISIRKYKAIFLLMIFVFSLALNACSKGEGSSEEGSEKVTQAPEGEEEKKDSQAKPTANPKNPNTGRQQQQQQPQQTNASESISKLAAKQNEKSEKASEEKKLELRFYSDGTYEFAQNNKFYSDDIQLTIVSPEGSKVYYTLDGSEPDVSSSKIYSSPLCFEAAGGNFPDAYTLRAFMVDKDGNRSDMAARTYLVDRDLENRFSTLIFFISGDPAELTGEPDGILYGDNVFNRGRDYERKVYIEAFEKDGEQIFAQYGGVRVYGGYSRNATIKSLKLYARKTYDEDHKNFKISAFNTPKLYEVEDGKSDVITKYDRLVLRNSGNDNQFAFIRDELSQRLCRAAGFDNYEEVIPVVVYLNGSYYSLLWLHESYCDKYFKEKYGDAEGEFIIAEGEDQKKSDDDDIQYYVDEYNEMYESMAASDLTDDAIYKKLCDFIDVESYLDFFAWNIALNNWDWPNNNFKCFRYVPEDGVSFGDGVFDGKWRFLPHDMDYTYGIYDQAKAKENYNTLKVVMDDNNERYSPLFTKLMQRKDCRHYFREKTLEYINGAQSEKSIKEEYEKLHAERVRELSYYYDFLQILNRKGYWDIWTQASNYAGNEQQIFTFAEKRAGYVVRYMEEFLPELE